MARHMPGVRPEYNRPPPLGIGQGITSDPVDGYQARGSMVIQHAYQKSTAQFG